MGYDTPEALWSALGARGKRRADELGVSQQELVRRFVFQRLLARVYTDEPDGWLLKGGQAMLVRYPHMARYTRDIDLWHPRSASLEEAVETLATAARVDLNDHLRFDVHGIKRRFEGASTARVLFTPMFGTKKQEPISVDLAVGLNPIGTPARRHMEPAVPLDWPELPWPNVMLYPIVDHTADKVCALYERHLQGMGSSRYRDLVDLSIISLNEPLDGRELRTALSSEVTRRSALGVDLRLPERFHIPQGPDWVDGYARQAGAVHGLEGFRSLEQASALVGGLLDPILAGEIPGRWQPEHRRWAPVAAPDHAAQPPPAPIIAAESLAIDAESRPAQREDRAPAQHHPARQPHLRPSPGPSQSM
jgi:hypothetical protein